MSHKGRVSLVADYRSSGESSSSETEDSQPDSSTSSETDLAIDSSDESTDLDDIIEPIAELDITIAERESVEVGRVKHIIDRQVIVEPKLDVAALDIETILFLENGKRALGRIDEVFGPVTEPLYIVLFNSAASIRKKSITVGMPVYYAPKTDHTSYVLVKDLMRMKGSDASYKHNQEIPDELQDFSDDEAERAALHDSNGHDGSNIGQSRRCNASARYGRGSRSRSQSFSPGRRPAWPNHRESPNMHNDRMYSSSPANDYFHHPNGPMPPCSPRFPPPPLISFNAPPPMNQRGPPPFSNFSPINSPMMMPPMGVNAPPAPPPSNFSPLPPNMPPMLTIPPPQLHIGPPTITNSTIPPRLQNIPPNFPPLQPNFLPYCMPPILNRPPFQPPPVAPPPPPPPSELSQFSPTVPNIQQNGLPRM